MRVLKFNRFPEESQKKKLSGFKRIYFTFSLFVHLLVEFYKMQEIFTLHTDLIDTLRIVINTSFIGRSHDWETDSIGICHECPMTCSSLFLQTIEQLEISIYKAV